MSYPGTLEPGITFSPCYILYWLIYSIFHLRRRFPRRVQLIVRNYYTRHGPYSHVKRVVNYKLILLRVDE